MRDLATPPKTELERGGAGARLSAEGGRALLAGDARYAHGSVGRRVLRRDCSSRGFGGGMQRLSRSPVALFAAASMLVVAALSGCSGPESDSSDEAVDEVSASIIEADELGVEGHGGDGARDSAGRALDPSAPESDGGGAALPSPGDLRAEPEPDPWNPGGDPTKKFGPNDT